MFMSGTDYRESLRACEPSVYVDGRKVKSVAADASRRKTGLAAAHPVGTAKPVKQ